MIARTFLFQVFDEIRNLLQVGGGHTDKETKAMIYIKFTDMNKLKYLFRQASCLQFIEKTDDEGKRANVMVSDTVPFCIAYSKKKERVFISYKYTWYNKFGICQK